MTRRGAFVLIITLVACGGGVSSVAVLDPPESNDAGLSDAASSSTPDSDAVGPVSDAEASLARCTGATYTTAPSGAPCDPSRIERSGSLEAPCSGPALGVGCDRLEILVPAGSVASVPAGFVCDPPDAGTATCRYSFDGSVSGPLDTGALEAACAATVAFPAEKLHCATHGS